MTEDKRKNQGTAIIKLSEPSWTHKQRMAIAKVFAQTLNDHTSVLGDRWSTDTWNSLLQYLKLTQQELEESGCHQIPTQQAVDLICSTDIQIEILSDVLALLLHVTDNITTNKKDATVMMYDARARRFLLELSRKLKLCKGDVASVERNVAQQMYYATFASNNGDEKKGETETGSGASIESNLDGAAKKAMEGSNKKRQTLKWIATGAGVIGGGALIALTGGLAAPLLAPLLVGMTGATFFATAGGVALVTSLFGLTGGGLAGWKMHRRMKGLSQFEFKQILQDPDLPPVPTLECTICISGFLLESKNETHTPWEHTFERNKNRQDVFCLEYETDALLELGYSFRRFIKDTAINYAGMEVAKATVLNAFFAAVALPLTLLKTANIIDNPWQIVADRSRKAGEVLADVLEERVQGNRPVNLVAYSCGTLVIWHCLLELDRRGKHGLVDNVVLMGSPISTESTTTGDWKKALGVVSGRFVNCYTSKDWVLAFIYRLHSLATNVAGLEAVVNTPGIENLEVEDQIDGHTKYPSSIKDILNKIELE